LSRRRFGLRDILRYGAVIFAALAVAYGGRVWDEASNDVLLSYRGAPAGLMVVDIRDGDGERMRRTEFSSAVRRSHSVQLPRGYFEARMRVGQVSRRTEFAVEGDGAVDVRWSDGR